MQGKVKEKRSSPFFSPGGPQDAGQRKKRRNLEGSQEVGKGELIRQAKGETRGKHAEALLP